MTDLPTKILLTVIAMGVWLNALLLTLGTDAIQQKLLEIDASIIWLRKGQ